MFSNNRRAVEVDEQQHQSHALVKQSSRRSRIYMSAFIGVPRTSGKVEAIAKQQKQQPNETKAKKTTRLTQLFSIFKSTSTATVPTTTSSSSNTKRITRTMVLSKPSTTRTTSPQSPTSSESSASTTTSSPDQSRPQFPAYSINTVFHRDAIAKDLGMDYDAADLVITIATKYVDIMLPNNIPANQLSQTSKLLCGESTSTVSTHHYITRIVRVLNEIYDRNDSTRIGLKSTGMNILVLATIYIDRLLELQKTFVLHPLNLHRVIFAAVIASIKYSEDAVPDQKLMALIGGISTRQVQICESRFCKMLNYQFWIDPETRLQQQFDQLCLPMQFRHVLPVLVWVI
jgi:hypothetical protein